VHLELKRHDNNATRCLGTLSIDGAYYCVTLEDTVRLPGVKVQDKTAIPAGTYKIIVNLSPSKHKLYPRLLDVPMFTGILIHSGNNEVDTKGCIIVGKDVSVDKKSIHGGSIVSPLLRDKLLLARAERIPIDITIMDDFGGNYTT